MINAAFPALRRFVPIPSSAPARPSTSGRPLPESLRRSMEGLFDADFTDVRVHVGPQADAIGALAFTWGSHLFFAPGTYRPETLAGRHLLAHELTHVLQQRTGRVGPMDAAVPCLVLDSALEAEAEEMGCRAAARLSPPPVVPGRASARKATKPVEPFFGLAIQPLLRIVSGTGEGLYDLGNLKSLLDGVAVVLNSTYHNRKVTRGPLEFTKDRLSHVGAREIYAFATMDALALWMIESYRPTPVHNQYAPVYEFGAGHGDLHFNGEPTKTKSKWSYSKAAACTLMETEIAKHLDVLFQQSSLDKYNPWSSWYVIGIANGPVGRYKQGNTTPSINIFTMQVQVNVRENLISYHGYPDENTKGRAGVGTSKNSI